MHTHLNYNNQSRNILDLSFIICDHFQCGHDVERSMDLTYVSLHKKQRGHTLQ
jgi:hypothetical protein